MKENKIKYKKIIAAGDSFTAGDELLGDELIPEYTKIIPRSAATRKELFHQYGQKVNQLSSNERFSFFERSKEKTWANKLAILLNLPIINVAGRGLSNQEISHRTLMTVKRQLNENYRSEDLLVLIMVTHPLRFGSPSDRNGKYKNEWNFETLYFDLETIDAEEDKKRKEFGRYILTNYDYFDLIWNSYCSVMGIIDYLKFKKIDHYIFDSGLWSWAITDRTYQYKDDFRYGIPRDLGYVVNPRFRLTETATESLPGGHAPEDIHEYFAKQLLKELFGGTY